MAWTMASRSSASEWPKVQDGMPLLRVRRWAQSPRWRHRRRGSETWSARSGATTYVKPFLATMGRGKVPGVSLNGGSGPKTPTCTVAMEFLASPDGLQDGRAPAAGEIASSHRRPECRQGEVEAGMTSRCVISSRACISCMCPRKRVDRARQLYGRAGHLPAISSQHHKAANAP